MPDHPVFTAGSYLRARRLSQNVDASNQDLALTADQLEAIETDARDPTLDELGKLMMGFEFSILHLVSIAQGGRAAVEASAECCRICACSECDPCTDDMGETCGWAEPGLCTMCIGKEAAEA